MSAARVLSRDTLFLVLRLALWGAAFQAAFEGQALLEGQRHLGRGVVHLAVATVLIAAATWGWPPRRGREAADSGASAGPAPRRWPLSLWLAVVALGLGIAFRVYLLDREPFGVWFDEAENGLIARQILQGDYPPIFIGGFTQLPSLFFYVFAGAARLMGEGIVSLRSVSTLGGLLALPMVFLLGRELFGTRVGVLSVFLLAVMRWHVNFSRFGVTNIWASFLALAAVYFLVRALRGRGWWNGVASGVFTGLGPYAGFYFTFIPAVMVLYWLHAAVAQRVLSIRGHVLAMAVVTVVAMGVYAPVGVWGLQHQDEFTARPANNAIIKDKSRSEAVQAVLKSTKQHVLMFNAVGDGNGRHNLPGEPMLDTFTGVFFILGIGMSVARPWRSENFLLLAWVVLVLQGGIWAIAFEAPQAFRTSAVTPTVAILAALPLGAALSLAYDRDRRPSAPEGPRPPLWRQAARALRGDPVGYAARLLVGLSALFLLAQIARQNFDTYFNKQLSNPIVWASYSAGPTYVAQELARLGGDHTILYSPTFAGQPTVAFLAPNAPQPALLEPARDLPLAGSVPTAFLLDANGRSMLELLRRYYPSASYVELTAPGGGPTVVYEAVVSEDDQAAVRGLTYSYFGAGPTQTGRLDVLDLDWRRQTPLPLPFGARWSGALKVPVYGEYDLAVRAPGEIDLRLDGETVARGDRTLRVSGLSLAEGLHDLDLLVAVRALGPAEFLWKPPGESTDSPVPASQLFSGGVRAQGLEGSYFTDAGGSRLSFVRIDPTPGGNFHIQPVPIPFTIIWRGYINVPSDGTYRFYVQAVDEGGLSVDGRLDLATPAPNAVAEGTVDLTAGRHEIAFSLRQRGGSPIYLYVLWAPPGSGPQPVPNELLSPY